MRELFSKSPYTQSLRTPSWQIKNLARLRYLNLNVDLNHSGKQTHCLSAALIAHLHNHLMSAGRRILLYLHRQRKRNRMLVELSLSAEVRIDCSKGRRRIDVAQLKGLIRSQDNTRGFGTFRHLLGRIKVPSIFDRSSQVQSELVP